MDIDELIGETEAALSSLLSLATGDTSEELKNDLESGVVFQQECVWRMNDLTQREAVEEGCEDEEKNERIQDDEGADGVSNQRGGRGRGGEERESNTGMKRTRGREMWEKEKEDERKGEAREKNEMEGERDGRKDIRDEDEEEDEEIKLARKTICEAVRSLDDLTSTPRPAVSVLQTTRLKPEQNPRKRTDSHNSNTPGPFGGGEPVREKPRPLLSQQSRVNFTIESLEQELTNIMDTCFQDDGASGDGVKFTTTTTITAGLTTPTAADTTYTTTAPTTNDITAVTPPAATDVILPTAINTTTTLITDDTNTYATCNSTATTPTTPITTTTAPHSPITPTTPTVIITPTNTTSEDIINTTTNKPTTPATIASDTAPNTPSSPSPPGHQRDTTSDPTTPTPLSTTPTDTQVFIYPRTSSSSTPATTPSSEDSDIHKHDNHRHHRFSSLMDGMKNLNWRNSLKKKKKRRNIEISDPTDFRQLKAITSIKPVQDLKGTAAQNGVRKGTERGQ